MKKIFLAQIDTIAGNIEYNSKKILDNIKYAQEKKGELIIFPQLALFGANFENLPHRHKALFNLEELAFQKIIEHTKNICVVIGYLNKNSQSSIAVIQNQKLIKTLSEGYDYFDIDGEKFAISFNEVLDINKKNLSAIIIPTCTASKSGKEFELNKKFSELAITTKSNVLYVNQVGYSNDNVFEGASRVYDNTGVLKARAEFFKEDLLEITNYQGKISNAPQNIEEKAFENFSLNYEKDLDRTYQAILCAIKGYFDKNGFKKAVLGLSGGLDSTISAVLLVDALGKENVLGISMPTKITSNNSKQDAYILAQNLGIEFLEVPIAEPIEVFTDNLKEIFSTIKFEQYNKSTTYENIQARTRATILWSISNECKNMLPIATSDKSELYIGYATINGDMSGGFAPLADVTKTKLFALGHFLNKNRKEKNAIPQNILEKPPGAELKFDEAKGRTITAEEDNMPYPFLDEIIWLIENKSYGINELLKHKYIFENQNKISEEQKEEWIKKFFDKMQKAVFKWHLLPPSVIIDRHTINQNEYKHPIISKIY